MSSSKDNNNSPITEFNDMEFCKLADKEFKIAFNEKTWQSTRKYQKINQQN